MNKHFTFTNVRFLYPNIITPKATFDGTGEEYSVVLLVNKNQKELLKKFVDTYKEMVIGEFKKPIPGLRPPIGLPLEKAVLKDGDAKYEATEIDKKPNYEPYKGHYYTNLAVNVTRGKVEAVDADRQPILSVDQFPSGARGHLVAQLSCYRSPKFGPQFSVKPVLIQVVDISEPIGPTGLSVDEALGLLPDSPGVGSVGSDTSNDFDIF